MSIGQKLKNARTRKKLSQSQVASGTQMMVQLVDALEKDDFSKVPAPIYCKGFIKLYAEYVGLDPAPLISEYNEKYGVKKTPHLSHDLIEEVPDNQEQPDNVHEHQTATSTEDLFDYATKQKKHKAHEQFLKKAREEIPPPMSEKIKKTTSSIVNKIKNISNNTAEKTSHILKSIKKMPESKDIKLPKTKENRFKIPDIDFSSNAVKVSIVAIGIIVLIFVISILVGKYAHSKPQKPEPVPIDKTYNEVQQIKSFDIDIEPPDPYIN